MMQNIPLAIFWETLFRRRWGLVLAVFLANFLPLLIYSLLRQDGVVDPLEPSMILMHVFFLEVGLFGVASLLEGTHYTLARLYAFPISNRALVAGHFIPAMLLLATFSLVSAICMNALFDLRWPLLGSALFAAAAVAVAQAAFWQAVNQFWRIAILSCAVVVMSLWHRSRYGSLFNDPSRMWNQVTLAELLTMLTAVMVAFFFAVRGVARCRRGDDLPDFGIPAFLRQRFNSVSGTTLRFRTPEHAQFWLAWRIRGWIMPGLVASGLFLTLLFWAIGSGDPDELFIAIAMGSWALVLAGFVCGAAFGGLGLNSSEELGHFMSTRPMTSGNIASIFLKAAVVSLGTAWSIWAIAAISSYLYLAFMVPESTAFAQLEPRWWFLPAIVIGSWVALTTMATSLLTGHSKVFIVGCVCLFLGVIVLGCVQKTIDPSLRDSLNTILVFVFGLALLFGTVWAFVAAYRKSLIEANAISFAFSVWLAMSSLVAIEWLYFPSGRLATYVLVFGFTASAVAPIAVAPLAISWNRVR